MLAEWRAKFILGRDVELEDWMVELVASGQGWQIPDTIYLGKAEPTANLRNRMVSVLSFFVVFAIDNITIIMFNAHTCDPDSVYRVGTLLNI